MSYSWLVCDGKWRSSFFHTWKLESRSKFEYKEDFYAIIQLSNYKKCDQPYITITYVYARHRTHLI